MKHESNQPYLMKYSAWLSWQWSAQCRVVGEADSPAMWAHSSSFKSVTNISLMKEQSVTNHQYRVVQQTEKTWQIRNRPTCQHVMILQKYKDKQFIFLWTWHFDRRCVNNPTV